VSRDPARRIANALGRRGLAAPARLLLDAHLPLSPLASDAGAALTPLLRALGGSTIEDLSRLLDGDDGMRRLIDELDQTGKRDAEPG
jgi:hypothetical protein